MSNKNIKSTVGIIIPKRNKNDSERFIACNGRRYLVKCGVPVDVPADVAEVYFNSAAQRDRAECAIETLSVK